MGYSDFAITPLIYKVAHKCSKGQNKCLKKFSISATQAAILGIIEYLGDGAINQKTLSEHMGVMESSISSVIKTMIKNGLIYKEQSKTDGRNFILKITEKGKEIGEKMKASADEFDKKFYANLTSDERATLKNILIKLI